MLPILFVTGFIDLVGFGLIIRSSPITWNPSGPARPSSGCSCPAMLARFVFAPIWGRVSDRVGRRPILLLGLLGSVAGYTLFALAGTLSLLFLGRILMGIFGATIPTAQAAVADVTAPQDRARGMGLIGAAIGLGFILGPALGGLLSACRRDHLPFLHGTPTRCPAWASAALAC